MKSIQRIFGFLGAAIIVGLLLLGQNMGVVADYTQGPFSGFTAGTYGTGNDNSADTATRGLDIPACHSQDASLGDVFVQVYVVGTGDNAKVRMAISTNGGTSFSSFEWVNDDVTVKQDYPDVQLYKDCTESNAVKAVVVWQEKPDNGPQDWTIKARERSFRSNTWGSVLTVSNPIDNNYNIYPKVSTCSGNDLTFWNIVWQRKWDAVTTHGICCRRYNRDTNNEGLGNIENIATPGSSNDDYKHPATDCVVSTNDYEVVYIIYDEFHQGSSPDNKITLEYGSPDPSHTSDLSTTTVYVDTSDDGDLSQDYPDIAAVIDDPNIIVDCVWIENDNNDEVYHKRSTNGGISFGSETQIDDDGDMNLRAVAVDSYIISSTNPEIKRCHVVWTTGTNVYFRDKWSTNGTWNYGFGIQTNGATTQYDEEFVDISTSEPPYTSNITAYAVWDVQGTAVFFGTA